MRSDKKEEVVPYAKLPLGIKFPEKLEFTKQAVEWINRGAGGQGFLFYINYTDGLIHVIPAVNQPIEQKTDSDTGSTLERSAEKKSNTQQVVLMQLNAELEKLDQTLETNQQRIAEILNEIDKIERLVKQQTEKKEIGKLSQRKKSAISPSVAAVLDRHGNPFEKFAVTAEAKSSPTGSAGGTGGNLHRSGASILGLGEDNLAGGLWLAQEGGLIGEIRTRSSANMKILRNPLFMLSLKDFLPTAEDNISHSQIYVRELPLYIFRKFQDALYVQFYKDKMTPEAFQANIDNRLLDKPIKVHLLKELNWESDSSGWFSLYFDRVLSNSNKLDGGSNKLSQALKDVFKAMDHPDFKEANNAFKKTAILLAARYAHVEALKYLLNSINKNISKKLQEKLLLNAITAGHFEIVKLLHQTFKYDIPLIEYRDGIRLLDSVLASPNKDIIDMYINEEHFDNLLTQAAKINNQTQLNEGLIYYIRQNKLDKMLALIQKGAIPSPTIMDVLKKTLPDAEIWESQIKHSLQSKAKAMLKFISHKLSEMKCAPHKEARLGKLLKNIGEHKTDFILEKLAPLIKDDISPYYVASHIESRENSQESYWLAEFIQENPVDFFRTTDRFGNNILDLIFLNAPSEEVASEIDEKLVLEILKKDTLLDLNKLEKAISILSSYKMFATMIALACKNSSLISSNMKYYTVDNDLLGKKIRLTDQSLYIHTTNDTIIIDKDNAVGFRSALIHYLKNNDLHLGNQVKLAKWLLTQKITLDDDSELYLLKKFNEGLAVNSFHLKQFPTQLPELLKKWLTTETVIVPTLISLANAKNVRALLFLLNHGLQASLLPDTSPPLDPAVVDMMVRCKIIARKTTEEKEMTFPRFKALSALYKLALEEINNDAFYSELYRFIQIDALLPFKIHHNESINRLLDQIYEQFANLAGKNTAQLYKEIRPMLKTLNDHDDLTDDDRSKIQAVESCLSLSFDHLISSGVISSFLKSASPAGDPRISPLGGLTMFERRESQASESASHHSTDQQKPTTGGPQ